jgi:hypothetical protein
MFPIALIQKILGPSWKTSLGGALTAAGGYLWTVPGYQKYSVPLMAAGAFFGLLFARDRNVSSEMQARIPGAAMPSAPTPIGTENYQPPVEIK